MKLNIWLWGIPMLGFLLAGCSQGRPIQADISPDGKVLVQTSEAGLILTRFEPQKHATVVFHGQVQGPVFSPDGRSVLFDSAPGHYDPSSKSKTRDVFSFESKKRSARLLEVSSGSIQILNSKLRPPFAWKDDSSQVAGLIHTGGQNFVVVCDARNGKLSRTLPDAVSASRLLWLPGTDEFAVGSEHSIKLVSKGLVKKLIRTRYVMAMGYVKSSRRLIWAEISDTFMKDLIGAKAAFFSCDLKGNDVQPVGAPIDVIQLLPPKALPLLGVYIAFSPDGSRIAVSGLAVVGKPADVDRWIELVKQDTKLESSGHKLSAAERAQVAAINREARTLEKAKRIDLKGAVAILNLADQKLTLCKTYEKSLGAETKWSRNGEKLAVALDEGAEVVDVPK